MKLATDISKLLAELTEQGQRCHQRRMLVISGDRHWCQEQGTLVLQQLLESAAVTIDSESAITLLKSGEQSYSIENVVPSKAVNHLGTETSLLLFNLFNGLDPDALASLSGSLVAGGVLVLLTPDLKKWPKYADPEYQRMTVHPFSSESIEGNFLAHMTTAIEEGVGVVRFDQQLGLIEGQDVQATENNSKCEFGLGECLTHDQFLAVEAIIKVMTGHRRRPLVMTADRGRGKSSALGIAAAQAIKDADKPLNILLTAPRFDAVETLFERAEALLPGADREKHQLRYQGSKLFFMPVDEILLNCPQASLLLVDEAAAIPIPLLQRLLKQYSRIAFATTVHGYEGTGRGFQLRFSQILDQTCKRWHQLKMKQPIRWSNNDPLERWIFDALLLDAEIAADDQLSDCEIDHCVFESISKNQLLSHKDQLRQIFALLVQAHYQTSPGDLRDLLDGLNMRLWVLRKGETIVGVTLLAEEGGFDAELSEAVWSGERRPRGHLLPQTLCAQSGWLEAASLRYWRVVRIAVHPRLQGRGYGSLMLRQLPRLAQQQGIDMVASSFAASAELLEFWQSNGFQCLRVGLTRDSSSGGHPVIVSTPLNDQAGKLQQQIRTRFIDHWIPQLSGPLQEMDPALVIRLLQCPDQPALPALSEQDQLDLIAYCFGRRGFYQAQPVLQLFFRRLLQQGCFQELSQDTQQWLVAKVIQNHGWRYCCNLAGLPGQRQLEQQIRTLFASQVRSLALSSNAKRFVAKASKSGD
ncbi:MAG: GNAT family N-acetyltransferase [Motiliproteus sp.]|nr:GNAT family N-acetyltransferase [Motiliproteus sp.]MCW9051789.1 GNAT family N-acetyltransferase [Motiliproteus sp.]